MKMLHKCSEFEATIDNSLNVLLRVMCLFSFDLC